MRTLRLLVLGETWTIPVGVLLLLLVGLAGEALLPAWEDIGGAVLLAGTLTVLIVTLRRG